VLCGTAGQQWATDGRRHTLVDSVVTQAANLSGEAGTQVGLVNVSNVVEQHPDPQQRAEQQPDPEQQRYHRRHHRHRWRCVITDVLNDTEIALLNGINVNVEDVLAVVELLSGDFIVITR
jgi:hypothetical protein